MRRKTLHPVVKLTLGYDIDEADKDILDEWKKRLQVICKPCWELKYCPYGPLVEEFPLPPLTREYVEGHNEYLKKCLATGLLGNGEPLDDKRRKEFTEELRDFDSADLPEEIPGFLEEASCRVFGHICPVYFVSEPLTETKTARKRSRHIPRDVILRVIRRDGQICQLCHEPVRDDEVEFDHIIPYSRGGTSTTDNLRLVHKDCNREKGNALEELLASDPVLHLFEMQKNQRKK